MPHSLALCLGLVDILNTNKSTKSHPPSFWLLFFNSSVPEGLNLLLKLFSLMGILCFSPGLFYLLGVVNACQFKNQTLGQMLQTHCPTCGQNLDKYIKQRIILSTGENTLHSVLQQINYLSHNLDYADSFIMYFQCPKILISVVGLSQFSIQTKFCLQMNAEQTQWRADVFYRILSLTAV